LTAYHVGLFLYAGQLPRAPYITPPLDGLPLFIYSQAVILFLLLAAVAGWGVRSTLRTMQTDMRQQRRRERELRRSNEELERFAYIASHDLQEPLRKIAGASQMLERRYGDQLGPDAAKWIAYSVDGAKRMQQLIQALLTFSRIDRGVLQAERVEVAHVVAQILEDYEGLLQQTGGEVEYGALPSVHGDATQVRQLFQNLLGNAIKYRHPQRPPRIRIDAEAVGSRVRFRVSDNGIGIPADKRDEVFQAFRRLHSRDEYEGAGIGLSICEKIVERHGGEIRVVPVDGPGTAFEFTLPGEP
jgi:light-regulated signal transduction histidine kinase (bacteriophytochrome)